MNMYKKEPRIGDGLTRKRPGYRHLLGLAVAAAPALTRLLLPSFLLRDGHALQMRVHLHLHLRLDQCFCFESYM